MGSSGEWGGGQRAGEEERGGREEGRGAGWGGWDRIRSGGGSGAAEEEGGWGA